MDSNVEAARAPVAPMRNVSIEFRKCRARWERDGLSAKYLSGGNILDIGFRGGDPDAVPITDNATGIELGFPGYDGTHLPFPDRTQDAVFASAVFEHIPNYKEVLREWYRVLKSGGFIIIFVPHKYLYERRPDLPSLWNGDHRRFYTPASLLQEIEDSLPANGYRVRHLLDDDEGFPYQLGQLTPPTGCYQIEIVIERIEPPPNASRLEYPPRLKQVLDSFDNMVIQTIAQVIEDPDATPPLLSILSEIKYFTPWNKLLAHFVYADPAELNGQRLTREQLAEIVCPWLQTVTVDADLYLQRYRDLAGLLDPVQHWRRHGYFAGRAGTKFEFDAGVGS